MVVVPDRSHIPVENRRYDPGVVTTERDRRARKRRWRRRWRKVKRARRSTWVLVAGCVAVAVFAGFTARSAGQSDPSAAAPGPTPAAEETEQQAVLVIGDSWAHGGTMNDGPEWPQLMDLPSGWTVYTNAIGGTGYVGDHPGSDLRAGGRFDDLLQEYDPAVVLVALGRNDIQHDPDEVIAMAKPELEAMQQRWPDAEIVVFSPFSPGAPDPATIVLTSRLHAMADSLGLSFVDVTDAIDSPEEQIEEGHPNDAGQRAVAKYVASQLVDRGAFS